MSAEFVDQDNYFDDDSDVPSHCDPLEELEESLLEEKLVEIDFDDEESSISSSACITGDWEEVKLDGDVTITKNDGGVDSEHMRDEDRLRLMLVPAITGREQLICAVRPLALFSTRSEWPMR